MAELQDRSELLVKRQKLDGEAFDLKVTRLEILANSPTKKITKSDKKESKSSGVVAENENIEIQQTSDKKSYRSNQQARKIIGVTFEQNSKEGMERHSLLLPKDQPSMLGSS